jgi:hypothetical protein
MFAIHRLVRVFMGNSLRVRQRLLGFDGQLVQLHLQSLELTAPPVKCSEILPVEISMEKR